MALTHSGPEQERLALWLAERRPGAQHVRITDVGAPAGGGASAETVLLDIGYTEGGREQSERLVLRRQLLGSDLFLNSDLSWQAQAMEAMARHPHVPVPALVGVEYDPAVLGAPFLVMQRVAGRIVPQKPNYNVSGWVADLSPAERRQLWTHAIEMIARIHQVPWREGFAFLDQPARGEPGLDQYLAFVAEWYAWAAQGRVQPVADAALDYLLRNRPAGTTVSVLWGDAIPANMLFAPDLSVSAVIDWEMVALGPGEMDLGWWLFFDHLYSEAMGVPRLEGIPGRAELLAIYETAAGRPVRDIDYFEILGTLRLAIVATRQYDRQVRLGAIPSSSRAYLDNPITAMLARKLGLPEPQVGQDYLDLLAASTAHH